MMTRAATLSLPALVCASLLMGCTEDVTAVLGTSRPFSLFGVLSPQLDSQWVRVFSIDDVLEPVPGDRLDAHFVSTDLTTGVEHVWRDSVIRDPFGQHAHVFWAPFRAEYGHRYRLVVRRSNGDESRVEATVPPPSEIVVREPEGAASFTRLPVSVVGDVPRLLRIEVVYLVGFKPAGRSLTSDEVSISYDNAQVRTAEGWRVSIDPINDFRVIVQTLAQRLRGPIDRDEGITLLSISLRLIVANHEWNPPDGLFNLDIMVQPDVMTNVENGFGFVGAGYRLEESWLPPDEVIERTGFRAPAD